MMEKTIKEKIGKKFKYQKYFCEKMGFIKQEFNPKLSTFRNKMNWLNDFVRNLDLKVVLIDTECTETINYLDIDIDVDYEWVEGSRGDNDTPSEQGYYELTGAKINGVDVFDLIADHHDRIEEKINI